MGKKVRNSTLELRQEQILIHNITLINNKKLRKPTTKIIIHVIAADRIENIVLQYFCTYYICNKQQK